MWLGEPKLWVEKTLIQEPQGMRKTAFLYNVDSQTFIFHSRRVRVLFSPVLFLPFPQSSWSKARPGVVKAPPSLPPLRTLDPLWAARCTHAHIRAYYIRVVYLVAPLSNERRSYSFFYFFYHIYVVAWKEKKKQSTFFHPASTTLCRQGILGVVVAEERVRQLLFSKVLVKLWVGLFLRWHTIAAAYGY